MNCDTGEIRCLTDTEIAEELCNIVRNNEVLINNNDMTAKQKLEMKVSLHDNRSKLGKLRVKLTKNQRRRERKRLQGRY